ncbi:RICIN domain-containing protein [Streptosporangium algeriense]|uniref:RICIN domain-containing protein n=1 Tax=Streptosporangium algeriense TaxID=1682748 RepID=A0ABW3E1A4_9ACTN
MRNTKRHQNRRAAVVAGTALFTLSAGLTAPAYATPAVPGTTRFFTIQPDHARGSMCLDVAHASGAHGADIVQARCTPRNRNQHWSIVSLGRGSRFEVRPRHTGSTTCMDVENFSRAHMANVLQAGRCTGGSNQAWTFRGGTELFNGEVVPSIGGLVQIRPSHVRNMCLDVAHLSIVHGANVIQGRCWNGPNQLWRFTPVPPGT